MKNMKLKKKKKKKKEIPDISQKYFNMASFCEVSFS